MDYLDCLGKCCPLPIIELAKKLTSQKIGYRLVLLSDDPATEPDLRAWARMTKNKVKNLAVNTFEITKLTS
jgi:TusA-related sulfurtransferase